MTDLYVYVVVYQFSMTERIYGTYRNEERACYALLREMTNLTRNCQREEKPLHLVWEKVISTNGMDYTTFDSINKETGKVMGKLFVRKTQVE